MIILFIVSVALVFLNFYFLYMVFKNASKEVTIQDEIFHLKGLPMTKENKLRIQKLQQKL
jgi:hypothetical protein